MTTTQPTYNLCDVRSLLHSHAYGSERSEPAKTTIEQYGDFCQHMQTVENTATDLKNIGAGLYLLIGLLEDSARITAVRLNHMRRAEYQALARLAGRFCLVPT